MNNKLEKTDVIENIKIFNQDADERLIKHLPYFKRWYAVFVGGQWLLAPSKFIGYKNMKYNDYFKNYGSGLNGGETEKELSTLSTPAIGEILSVLEQSLHDLLMRFEKKPPKGYTIKIITNDSV